jgi:hypothetical protein
VASEKRIYGLLGHWKGCCGAALGFDLSEAAAMPPIAPEVVGWEELTRCAKAGCEQSQQDSSYSVTSLRGEQRRRHGEAERPPLVR